MRKIFIMLTGIISPLWYTQIGINTYNPQAALDIVSKGSTSASKGLKITNSVNSEMLTLLDNGNLGIGVSNPSAKVHTNGSLRFEGLIDTTTDVTALTIDNNGLVSKRATGSLFYTSAINGKDAIPTAVNIIRPGSTGGDATWSNLLT